MDLLRNVLKIMKRYKGTESKMVFFQELFGIPLRKLLAAGSNAVFEIINCIILMAIVLLTSNLSLKMRKARAILIVVFYSTGELHGHR